ncbi:MAG: hypothetical protein ACRBG0_15010 [Lewinella sp.]
MGILPGWRHSLRCHQNSILP